MKHDVEKVELKNGVKGLMIDVPSASVMAVNFDFRAGDYLSPAGKWEVAHVLEHMVLGANKYYPRARLFSAEYQKNGAYLNAWTGTFSLQYVSEFADFEWERILDLLVKCITTPLLKESEFRAEKGNVREELVGYLNAHYRQLSVLSSIRFGLIGLNDAARLKQLRTIKLKDVQKHYRRTHTTDNLRFIIAGNLSRRRSLVMQTLENLRLPRGERFETPSEKVLGYDGCYYIEEPDLSNIYFQWQTFSNKPTSSRQEVALAVAGNILTGTLHSKILGKARSRGLIYSLYSSFDKDQEKSDWRVGSEILPRNSVKFFTIMVEEIDKLLNGRVSLRDIEAAKQFGLGTFQRLNQTVTSVLNLYAGDYFYHDRVVNFEKIRKHLQTITKAEVVATMRQLFEEKIWGFSVMASHQPVLAERLHAMLSKLWGGQ